MKNKIDLVATKVKKILLSLIYAVVLIMILPIWDEYTSSLTTAFIFLAIVFAILDKGKAFKENVKMLTFGAIRKKIQNTAKVTNITRYKLNAIGKSLLCAEILLLIILISSAFNIYATYIRITIAVIAVLGFFVGCEKEKI